MYDIDWKNCGKASSKATSDYCDYNSLISKSEGYIS